MQARPEGHRLGPQGEQHLGSRPTTVLSRPEQDDGCRRPGFDDRIVRAACRARCQWHLAVIAEDQRRDGRRPGEKSAESRRIAHRQPADEAVADVGGRALVDRDPIGQQLDRAR